MAIITIPQSQAPNKETYNPDYLKWKGYVDRIPLLNSIIEAKAAAVCASWRTYGNNAKAAADMLDGIEGNGKESFKLLINNMYKVAITGGDAFAEIIYNSELGLENLMQLNPNDITIHMKNGVIKKYEDNNSGTKFKPGDIFHLPYSPAAAMCYGRSTVEPMQNLLHDWLQLVDDMSKIYHRYIKPVHVIEFDSDDPTQIANFKTEWAKLKNIPEADIIIPKGLVSITRASIPQFSTLDPTMFQRVLVDHIIMGSRVPELALGTGSVNSEESARMQFMGFRQAVRWDQKWLEEHIRSQLLYRVYPQETPKLKWSFATEPQEEQFKRLMTQFQTIGASPLNEELKGLILLQTLIEAGVIEDVGRERTKSNRRRAGAAGARKELEAAGGEESV